MRVFGRVLARPTIISEKKTPIDSDEPALKNVPRMPAADPRWSAGTAFITWAVLGEENMPEPTPLRKVSAANIG